MHDYDIVVAGGGIAGALAGAAAAKGGAKTIILDRNDYAHAGKKTNWGWVCGDAVAKSHTDFVTKELGLKLDSPEIDVKVDGVLAISPDMKSKFLFDGEGYVLDRPKLAKKLIDFAKKCGAEYRPLVEVEGPIIEENNIVGVFGRDEKKEQFKLRSKLVIDALGIASTIRRKLPVNDFVQREVSIEDVESTGRYIIKFESKLEDVNYYDPKNALIHLNQVLAPGGYGWVFPKSNHRMNVGVGVEKKSLDMRNAKLGKKDSLHQLIDEYIKWNPVIDKMEIDETDANGKGYWSVAVRRQLDSLVYNNYLGAGDSMAMPNPISAGGIGPAMVAGVLAGELAADAIKNNDTSLAFLWKYNVRFNELYGNKTAGLEAFRVYLQSLNNDLINYGMGHFLTKDQAVKISYGLVPELDVTNTMLMALQGLSNINAFRNLVYTVKKMKRLNDLYTNHYPNDPESFAKWKETINVEMREVKERFKVNPI